MPVVPVSTFGAVSQTAKNSNNNNYESRVHLLTEKNKKNSDWSKQI